MRAATVLTARWSSVQTSLKSNLVNTTKPALGRISTRHGKLSVSAIQSGFPDDGSLGAGKGGEPESNNDDPQRLASNLAASTSGAAAAAFKGPLSALKSIAAVYNVALKKHPVATKALTSLIGFALGDRIAQQVGGAPFDIFR